MEIVALSMPAMRFIFGSIANTRVDQIEIEDQRLKDPRGRILEKQTKVPRTPWTS